LADRLRRNLLEMNHRFLRSLVGRLRAILRGFGIDLVRYEPSSVRLVRMLACRKVELVVDVGANEGQFARALRRAGYNGRIVSFEPHPGCAASLKSKANDDPLWDVIEKAMSDRSGSAELRLTQNSVFSSIHQPDRVLHAIDGGASEVGVATVERCTLDEALRELGLVGEPFFLKVDTQGHDHLVLGGARESLESIVGIQIELAWQPGYAGQLGIEVLHPMLVKHGFRLSRLDEVFRDFAADELREVDGTYWRPARA
jgi:FkbM family methyltransferase